MKKYFLHFIFIVIVVGDLVGVALHESQIDQFFKPLIMLWIGGYFLLHARKIDREVVLMASMAFLFSWIGDVLLMFGERSLYFILDIGGFLVAQLFYVFLFLRTITLSGKKPFLKKKPFFLLPYLIYGISIYIVLFPHLDGVLWIAVLVYMTAILSASAMALNRYGNGHPVSFSLVYAGSLLFVLSDSLIAIDRFLLALPYVGIFIMATYIAAQYLILRGILMQYK